MWPAFTPDGRHLLFFSANELWIAALRHGGAHCQLALSQRRGKAENDSALLRRARGTYALLLNEDSELLPGATLALHEALSARADAACAGASLLAPDGKLARRWPMWVISALLAYAVAVVVTIVVTTSYTSSQLLEMIGSFTSVLSCAASSFAFLAIFVRFARSRVRLFDSLRANSYGIYLIHYPFVSWLQYALLRAPLSAPAKASIVFVGALVLSWSAINAMRRVREVARVI